MSLMKKIKTKKADDGEKEISVFDGLVPAPMKKVASITGHEISACDPPSSLIVSAMEPEISLEPE